MARKTGVHENRDTDHDTAHDAARDTVHAANRDRRDGTVIVMGSALHHSCSRAENDLVAG
ncbi:MAG: hypothetical protein EBX36_01865 [Planctomycetia bacterium]|nr:hypothetical protein [Planctomycetia bacterium]